jgi:hypothetical protein
MVINTRHNYLIKRGATLTNIRGTFSNAKEKEYKMLETATTVTVLEIRRLLSLLGTNAIFNVFVSSKSL